MVGGAVGGRHGQLGRVGGDARDELIRDRESRGHLLVH
jgi:hypothetical protein